MDHCDARTMHVGALFEKGTVVCVAVARFRRSTFLVRATNCAEGDNDRAGGLRITSSQKNTSCRSALGVWMSWEARDWDPLRREHPSLFFPERGFPVRP